MRAPKSSEFCCVITVEEKIYDDDEDFTMNFENGDLTDYSLKIFKEKIFSFEKLPIEKLEMRH